jgi:hypothetical protein
MRPSGKPLTKITTSARRFALFSMTMYWFTKPVVGIRIVKVDQAHLHAAYGAIRAADLHRNALDDVAMQTAVLRNEGRRLRLKDLIDRVSARFSLKSRIQLRDGGSHPLDEQHIAVACALGVVAVRADFGAVRRGVAKFDQPSERGLFDMAFGETRTHATA